jgi:hypothetical protein
MLALQSQKVPEPFIVGVVFEPPEAAGEQVHDHGQYAQRPDDAEVHREVERLAKLPAISRQLYKTTCET